VQKVARVRVAGIGEWCYALGMQKRLEPIDGLRGVAGLAVFLIHTGGMGLRGLSFWGNSLADHGKFGVTLFFVVSAFSLCLSLAPAFEGAKVDWRGFFTRRFFRIMPLFYVVTAGFAVAAVANGDSASSAARIVLNHVTLLSTFEPATRKALIFVEWSIFVEFLFYFLFPAALASLLAFPRSIAVVAAVLLVPQVRESFTDTLGISQPQFTLFWHFQSFLAGMLVYYWLRDEQPRRPIFGSALFGTAVALSVVAVAKNEYGLSLSLVTLASALTIAAIRFKSPLVSWLGAKPIVWVGAVSFSVYLLHPLVIRSIGKFGFLAPTMSIVALVLTLSLSWVTYSLIERPGQAIGRRLCLSRQQQTKQA
jgi:peptidoglycan/LPS O-acetylase OafA/YrhL